MSFQPLSSTPPDPRGQKKFTDHLPISVADIPLSIFSPPFFRPGRQAEIADYLLDTFINSNGKSR